MATRDLRRWLLEFRRQGCCILLSSHVMQEVTALADDIVIISHGRIAAAGTPQELSAEFRSTDLENIFIAAVNRVAS
jgi:sodium transport system ATP-binding protein